MSVTATSAAAEPLAADEVAVVPGADWRVPLIYPGGESAEHVVYIDKRQVDFPAFLVDRSDGSKRSLGTVPQLLYNHDLAPRLLDGVVARPVATDSAAVASVDFEPVDGSPGWTITLADGERFLSYAGAHAIVVGAPDGTGTVISRRTVSGSTPLVTRELATDARVIADALGVAVGSRNASGIEYLAFASPTPRTITTAPEAASARLTWMSDTELGYQIGHYTGELVRHPRAGGASVRVAHTGWVEQWRRVGNRLVVARTGDDGQYDLIALSLAGDQTAHLGVRGGDDLGLETFGVDQVAVTGRSDIYSGRLVLNPLSSSVLELAHVEPALARTTGIALAGGRLRVAQDSVRGREIRGTQLDPTGESLLDIEAHAVGPRPAMSAAWACQSFESCSQVLAHGTLTAYMEEPTPYAQTGKIVVRDGATQVAQHAMFNALGARLMSLSATHLLFADTNNVVRTLRLSDGSVALADGLLAVWGPHGYRRVGGTLVRVSLTSSEPDVLVKADDGCTVNSVVARGPWVLYDCVLGISRTIKNTESGATVDVTSAPWVSRLGDGIAVGVDRSIESSTLKVIDLAAEGAPTSVVSEVPASSTDGHWAVDSTGGRLVAWVADDRKTHVRRLGGVASAARLLGSSAPTGLTPDGDAIGDVWRPAFDFSGQGLIGTLTISDGSGAARREIQMTGRAGALRPEWDGTDGALDPLPSGAYTYAASFTALDGSTAPPAITGSVSLTRRGDYTAVAPVRLVDTRLPGGGGALAAGATRSFTVTGVGNVPATGVDSVVVNVTAVRPSASGYLTVFPAATARPGTSNLNFPAGRTIANLAMVRVGTGGRVSVFNPAGSVHVLIDVIGFHSDGSLPGASYVPLTPRRVLDTRTTLGGPVGAVGAGKTRSVVLTSTDVPVADAVAVVANITAVTPTNSGYLTVHPGGVRPTVSTVNFVSGGTIANLTVARVGPGGAVAVFNSAGATHVLVDVVGYYTLGRPRVAMRSIAPQRILDTRIGLGAAKGPITAASLRAVVATGVGNVALNEQVVAVVVNVTAVAPTTSGYLTVFPDGARPRVSNVNFGARQTIPNLVVVKVGGDQAIRVFNSAGSTHVLFDVVGYYT